MGRLFDVFAAKYGPSRVFQDVSSSSPGVDFGQRIESTIAGSDVVLVVIGPNWLSSAVATGERRIDQPDDFVRREGGRGDWLGAAGGAGAGGQRRRSRVAEDLPDDLAGLLHRQAVTVRDASWHQDVDSLIRQLEGQPLPLVGRRRTTAVIASVVVVLLAVGGVVALLANDDDPASGDNDSGQFTGCPATGAPYTPVELANDPVETFDLGDAHVVEARIVGGWTVNDDNGTGVLVSLEVTNRTERQDDTFADDVYLGMGVINGLLVDGIDQGDAWCKSDKGDPELEPGEKVVATIGWTTNVDPTGAPITLQAFGDRNLVVSG